jgi:hypothetical protein
MGAPNEVVIARMTLSSFEQKLFTPDWFHTAGTPPTV